MRRVCIDDLRRGDFIVVRWRDASDTRGFMEEFGETCWMKDWGFYLGIVGMHPQLIISKDVAEGHQAWGVSRIPIELIEEILLVIPCEEAKEMVPELRFKGRRIRTRRYDREEFTEVVIQDA